ncbi:MAG TPA: flagellar biosynthesis protein FliQ [Armatimonadota bacterium]|jgi:flagellar biosynthetic protein FliQ|nr:flagellar biosynthesis protein FliQ [Armatimonadota bacterium]HOM83728.1 flagellar biosynthesis protein FliQ [Armatimonadota bacterium]HPO71516.1 flagellar biosynthesis protein FliQ [Armatimonadota bacterium]
MLSQEAVLELARGALTLAVQLMLPAVGLSMMVGLAISVVQAATQIQESTLQVVPRIIAVFVALALFGSWMLRMAIDFTIRVFTQMPGLAK